jgi:hypothetical protein
MTRSQSLINLLLMLRLPRLQTVMIKFSFQVFHPVLLWFRVIVLFKYANGPSTDYMREAWCEEQVRMVKCRFRRYIDLPNPKEKKEQPPSLGNAS